MKKKFLDDFDKETEALMKGFKNSLSLEESLAVSRVQLANGEFYEKDELCKVVKSV